MISCILVDDEIGALKALAYEMNNFSDRIVIKTQFSSATNAISYLKSNAVDVVFLDIEMPEMNGLTFLEQFPNRDFQVIFTTAYSKYAVNAIKKDALDYLLKPVDIDDLDQAIKRIEKVLLKKKHDDFIEIALDKINKLDFVPKKIKISFDGKIHFLDPSDIVYLEGDGNYCTIHLENGGKMLLSHNLKNIETSLPESIFYRVHKSYTINLQKVSAYHKNERYIELNKSITVPVSFQKKDDILGKL